MSKKKVVVIGRGTVGAICVGVLLNKYNYDEVIWAYNPDIPTTSVGEGSNLILPKALGESCRLNWDDLIKVHTVPKTGIYKRNWPGSYEFLHDFPAHNIGLHFNALELQDYLYNKFKNEYSDRVTFLEGDYTPASFDSEKIVACTGNPNDYSNYVERTGIPVNACYVQQFPWKFAKFDYSLTIAMKHGWCFGIPLRNRLAIGYLYNSSITTIDEIKEDVKSLVDEFAEEPASQERVLNFKNYSRNIIFDKNTLYTGNAGFFLEPLEATSTGAAINNLYHAAKFWDTPKDFFTEKRKERIEENIQRDITAVEAVICLHYLGEPKFDTPFWKYAQDKAKNSIKNAIDTCPQFKKRIEKAINAPANVYWNTGNEEDVTDVGSWGLRNYALNIYHLGIREQLKELLY